MQMCETEGLRLSKFKKNVEVLAYYESVFEQWDHNKDGYISISELKRLIATTEDVNLTRDALLSLFSRFDCNNDELLDFDEFLKMVNHPSFRTTFRKIAQKYLRFVIIPRSRAPAELRRTVTNTGAYEREAKCKKTTIGMIVISAIQIIIHHLNYAYWEDRDDDSDDGPIGNLLRFDRCRKGETYRYITYIFIHNLRDNHAHLYFNVLYQLLLGIPLEMFHSWRCLLVYFIGAIGGSLSHSVFSKSDRMIGASGAVYSFVASYLATVLLNWREMSHPIVSILLFGIIVVFDVIYEIIMKHVLKIEGDTVSYTSHCGGFVIGFLLGIIILRNLRVTQREKVLWIVCFVTFIAIISLLIAFDTYLTMKSDICDD